MTIIVYFTGLNCCKWLKLICEMRDKCRSYNILLRYCICSLLQLNKSSFFKCLYQKGETILLPAPQERGGRRLGTYFCGITYFVCIWFSASDADMQRIKLWKKGLHAYLRRPNKSIFACRIWYTLFSCIQMNFDWTTLVLQQHHRTYLLLLGLK